MFKKHTFLAWALSILFALFAVSFVIQLVDDAGTPILLDADNKLELPPPPKTMYQIGKDAKKPPPPTNRF